MIYSVQYNVISFKIWIRNYVYDKISVYLINIQKYYNSDKLEVFMKNNEMINLIKRRRSIRNFKEEQLKEDELNQILECAIYAPTGCYNQPWHFTIIQNKDVLNKMSEISNEEMSKSDDKWLSNKGKKNKPLFFNAPTVVVVSGKEDAYSPLTDCSAAIENMLLAAESLDIGSLWCGLVSHFFERKEVEVLNIPEGYKPYYAIALGYKDGETPEPLERRRDIFTYII